MIALKGSFKLAIFMMRLTIIGFGNQAKSWAQNLRDSNFPVRVALQSGSSSFQKAKELGLETVEVGSDEFYQDQAFVLLIPDHLHEEFMDRHAGRFLTGSFILYNHGFSIQKNHFQEKYSNLNHILFAVKAIGSEIRTQYLQKGKLGAVFSIEYVQVEKEVVLSWLQKLANALGINMGPFATTFRNETWADLYSEQGLLCSLIPYSASEMFNTMVRDGIEPELAYLECWHELKLIVNAMVDKGPEAFFDLISPNALVGSEKGYQRLFNSEFKQNLESLYSEIKDGTFDDELPKTSIQDLKNTINLRWSTSPLMKTFHKLNP